jgi:uncharacterized protein
MTSCRNFPDRYQKERQKMEERITFPAGPLELEGLLHRGSGSKGAVITHPHPLYGGDMNNPVVECLRDAYGERGYTTLRFNFRGVGRSQGVHGDGLGELADVEGAIAAVSALALEEIDLAGYSFGAWVNARVKNPAVAGSVMVSPPVAFIDFKEVSAIPGLKLVVTGSRDDIAPADRIEELLPFWNPAARFEVLDGIDHFYGGGLDRLKQILTQNL